MEKYISYKDIVNHLDIVAGDSLFVSSDIATLYYQCLSNNEAFDGNIFIDSIISKIGKSGTLIFPTYNWDFCKGEQFDYFDSVSKTGALTKIALKRGDFRRTKHPIYSFAVWGKNQGKLCNMLNKSSFGNDSPFAYFYQNNVKNLFIGVNLEDSGTFVHYVEEKVGVSYRYLKNFVSKYKDEFGRLSEKTYSMYVRDLDMDVQMKVNFDDIFMQSGIVKEYLINNIVFKILEMRPACDLVEKDILNNDSKNICGYIKKY
jgi:aminoglycoside 3-N-acetyltransferase